MLTMCTRNQDKPCQWWVILSFILRELTIHLLSAFHEQRRLKIEFIFQFRISRNPSSIQFVYQPACRRLVFPGLLHAENGRLPASSPGAVASGKGSGKTGSAGLESHNPTRTALKQGATPGDEAGLLRNRIGESDWGRVNVRTILSWICKDCVKKAFKSKENVSPKTQNLGISRCCFVEDGLYTYFN